MHLNIFVSQKCFLHCKGCYSFSRTEDYSKIISTDILVSFLNYAYQRGVYKVTLCGGDPLTRCDILKLLKRIKKLVI
jgi:organic radical activating enzyme